MIELIGYSISEDHSVFIAWNLNGVPQPDIELDRNQVCELLMEMGYIADYHDGGDVAVEVNGVKHWMSLERWVADDMSKTVALQLINNKTSAK